MLFAPRSSTEILRTNLLSPYVLAFALGPARLLKSDLAPPRDPHPGLSIYLLFGLGLKGGVEISHAPLAAIALPALVTVLLG